MTKQEVLNIPIGTVIRRYGKVFDDKTFTIIKTPYYIFTLDCVAVATNLGYDTILWHGFSNINLEIITNKQESIKLKIKQL